MSKFNFTINGIELSNDTLYQIIPKLDLDAPEAYVQLGTSKLLNNDIKEGAPCIFDDKKMYGIQVSTKKVLVTIKCPQKKEILSYHKSKNTS